MGTKYLWKLRCLFDIFDSNGHLYGNRNEMFKQRTSGQSG